MTGLIRLFPVSDSIAGQHEIRHDDAPCSAAAFVDIASHSLDIAHHVETIRRDGDSLNRRFYAAVFHPESRSTPRIDAGSVTRNPVPRRASMASRVSSLRV